MAYIVRHPFADFFNLTRVTFDEGGKRLNERAGRVIARRIPVDVYADDDGYTIEANLPGFGVDEISIDILEDVVTLKAAKNGDVVEESENPLHTERYHGPLARSFRLPTLLDSAKAKAAFANGVLTVHVPKVEAAKPRAIKVKVAK